jgi:ATP-dependent DNA helicase RecQ
VVTQERPGQEQPTTGQAQRILADTFGFENFRGDQADIVSHVINGGDAVVLMPTGSGKSLCYQIPALARPGTGLVISPLVALMHDQVAALRQVGVRAAALNSSLSPSVRSQVENAFVHGELDLLYLAPERLSTVMPLLQQARLSVIAIDEAHCVSQWGHDFRPDYLRLAELADLSAPRIALTATATPETHREITERLDLGSARHFVSSFDRPNIRYRVASKDRVKQQLQHFVCVEHAEQTGIVYALSRKTVERTAAALRELGVDALAYHAGMSPQERERAHARFSSDEGIVMVATIAFGMGVDMPNVRFVAHIDLPKSLEGYYQETGRAGRDGQPADAWLAYGLGDVVQQRRFIDASQDAARQRALLDHMLAYCETVTCRRQFLLGYFGETLEQPCQNCDVCLAPPEVWDATTAAQKLLSTVIAAWVDRKKRFAAGQHIDVLRGVSSERTRRDDLETLSTWGIGDDLSASQWKSLVRHLLARGLLKTLNEWGTLAADPLCQPVLRGDERVTMRKQKMGGAPAPRPSASTTLTDEQQKRFEALRQWRREEAKRQEVPSFVVFGDVTLRQLACEQPTTRGALRGISGIGDVKLDRYGDDVLRVLANAA